MKKQVRLTAVETTATNKDFYNLFRPIAPSIDVIGKIAQLISGITEAISVWHITQSELSGIDKSIAIGISIVATILIVLILEIGGRKFLQVLTRALVWKKLQNVWYKSLFGIVSLITIGIAVLSFQLSTNGIRQSFVSKVPTTVQIDKSSLRKIHNQNTMAIANQFDKEKDLIDSNHEKLLDSYNAKYHSKVNEIMQTVDDYNQRFAKGVKWAKSHADKYRTKAVKLETEKAAGIAGLSNTQISKLEDWQARKNSAIAKEKKRYEAEIDETKLMVSKEQSSKAEVAQFWGALFSYLVGFSVILAFVCIVTVEVYRRGSGIKVEYTEDELNPSILMMIWRGFADRIDHFFRGHAERFARVNPNGSRQIGFGQGSAMPSMSQNSGGFNAQTQTDFSDQANDF